jgi:hypothetical protein
MTRIRKHNSTTLLGQASQRKLTALGVWHITPGSNMENERGVKRVGTHVRQEMPNDADIPFDQTTATSWHKSKCTLCKYATYFLNVVLDGEKISCLQSDRSGRSFLVIACCKPSGGRLFRKVQVAKTCQRVSKCSCGEVFEGCRGTQSKVRHRYDKVR